MPGSGINESNLLEIAEKTQAKEFHTTAKNKIRTKTKFQNNMTLTSGNPDGSLIEKTDEAVVKKLVELLKTAN